MNDATATNDASDRTLTLSLLLDAPREQIWRCWTTPALLEKWFAPEPFTATVKAADVRPGGASHVVMEGPGGFREDIPGVYLEVVPNEKLVFTDAFTAGFVPKDGAPFMVAEIALSDEDGKTRYVATARHWSAEARAQHEQMGFREGWTQCARQLEALARSLAEGGLGPL
ncbi:MAG: SRPBCC family protein [Myxococcales bacterium]|nr:SRPBCC family protein [Myxococcales bacterium]MCB9733699.1 SRPBCC family protein [Deltaproteobacteria bacterium]